MWFAIINMSPPDTTASDETLLVALEMDPVKLSVESQTHLTTSIFDISNYESLADKILNSIVDVFQDYSQKRASLTAW